MGHQFDVHLDLARHMKEDEGAQLSAAFKRLIGILARASSGDLAACFATFRDQLSEDGAGLAGLDALDAEFYKTTNVPARLVEFARLHPEAFFSG